jgi:phospholipase C
MSIDRRSLLQMLSASALSASLPASIARALAIPANNKTGTLADVEHIVFLMQENRAFDHYLGTLNGVRGFNDPRAVKLHGGNSVFYQPVVAGTPAPYVLPYHPTAPNLGLQFIEDLEHDWDTTHVAWNVGNWDQWVPAKSPLTMVYLDRTDIPYHYALADAFTVCDAYHASLLGPTDPNRYHMFTGWVGNDGSGGGPVVDNAEAGYSWLTFPEILQDGGITWRVYQDIGTGLNAAGSYGDDSADPLLGNYGDNSLLYFDQYRNASTSSPLYQQAVTGTDAAVSGTIFDRFRADCAGATLPQVSWICAPEAYSEHPNWPANYGAYYVSQILDALTANPEVWSKTVLFVMYDENDGFFDHMVPPTPPQSAAEGLSTVPITNEIFPGGTDTTSGVSTPGPYGLGARVPMFVISPWSKGGWVCSEVFDHTSLIQFVQARFGTEAAPLTNPNVTPGARRFAVISRRRSTSSRRTMPLYHCRARRPTFRPTTIGRPLATSRYRPSCKRCLCRRAVPVPLDPCPIRLTLRRLPIFPTRSLRWPSAIPARRRPCSRCAASVSSKRRAATRSVPMRRLRILGSSRRTPQRLMISRCMDQTDFSVIIAAACSD